MIKSVDYLAQNALYFSHVVVKDAVISFGEITPFPFVPNCYDLVV